MPVYEHPMECKLGIKCAHSVTGWMCTKADDSSSCSGQSATPSHWERPEVSIASGATALTPTRCVARSTLHSIASSLSRPEQHTPALQS